MKISKLMVSAMAVATIGAIGFTATPVNASTKDEISANKTSTADLLSQISSANAELIKLNQQVSAKNDAIASAKGKITATSKRIDQLKGQIGKAQVELSARKATLKQQLISLQKKAGNSVSGNVYVDFILNSKDISDLVSRSLTVSKLNRANKDAMDAVSNAKKKLAGLKGEQETKKADLVSTKDQLESDKTKLVALQSDAKDKQSALTKKISANKSTLVKLEAQANKEDAEAAAKVKALAAATATTTTSSSSTTSATTSSSSSSTSSSTSSSSSSSSASAAASSNTSSGNTYSWGQCTWYVKQVAPWVGNNWGNGQQWAASAAAAGFTVNNSPSVGSVVVFQGGQNVGGWTAAAGYGHVAYVTGVSGNTITIQQGGMGFSNPAGPNTQTVSGASNFQYIHR